MLNEHYRELVLFRAFSGLRSESSRNYLSFAWWVIDPLISMSVYYLVFGGLFGRGTANYAAFLLVGLAVWQWFAFTVSHCMSAIFNEVGLMNQVYLPKQIFPLVVVTMDTVKFGFVLILLLLFLRVSGLAIGWHVVALVPLLAVQSVLNAGAGMLAAAVVPFAPDLRFLISAFLQLAFFVSGVLFPLSTMSGRLGAMLALNPMVSLIEGYRAVLLEHAWPNWHHLFVVGLVAAALFGGSYGLIQRFDRDYPRLAAA